MARSRRHAAGAAARQMTAAASVALVILLMVATQAGAAFDARDNRFEYAREYRDPTWPGSYLRGRWYDPQLPAFVSRDPAAEQLNHYGYGGADPVQHVDPSGHSYRDFGRALGAQLERMNGGVGGHFTRIFLTPFVGPMQIVANPKGFWKAVEHDKAGMDAFIVAGIASEWGLPAIMRLETGAMRETVRSLSQAMLGVGQSAVASMRSPRELFDLGKRPHGFDAKTFGEGLEYTFGPLGTARIGVGADYQPFNLKAEDVDRAVERLASRPRGPNTEALFFRVRATVPRRGWTTPWMELTDWGLYHDKLFVVTRSGMASTEFVAGQVQRDGAIFNGGKFSETLPWGGRETYRFEYVGKTNNLTVAHFTAAPALPVSRFGNQCHLHVNGVLRACGIR